MKFYSKYQLNNRIKSNRPKYKTKNYRNKTHEKIHEVLCPKDLAFYTYEFKDYYIIYPPILDEDKVKKLNIISKSGKSGDNFEYSSGTNKNFLKVKEISKYYN